MTAHLTQSMRLALEALDAQSDKRLHMGDFRKAMKVTSRGFYLVLHRMIDRRLVARENHSAWIQITYGGLRALKEVRS